MNPHQAPQRRPNTKIKKNVFRKTQLCPQFQRGHCARGATCNFAHGQHELRTKPNLAKTRMCPNIQQSGECTIPNCKYAHDIKELKHTNDLYKTSLCIKFGQGYCSNDENCRYAHGEKELRSKDSNINSGHYQGNRPYSVR